MNYLIGKNIDKSKKNTNEIKNLKDIINSIEAAHKELCKREERSNSSVNFVQMLLKRPRLVIILSDRRKNYVCFA
jgi:hypothetical protein